MASTRGDTHKRTHMISLDFTWSHMVSLDFTSEVPKREISVFRWGKVAYSDEQLTCSDEK